MSERPKPDIDIEAERPGFEQNITSFGWSLDRTPSGHYRYEHVEFHWRGFLARARLAAERERSLLELLADAQHAVCCYSCPEPREGEPARHCELCRKITETLKKGPSE